MNHGSQRADQLVFLFFRQELADLYFDVARAHADLSSVPSMYWSSDIEARYESLESVLPFDFSVAGFQNEFGVAEGQHFLSIGLLHAVPDTTGDNTQLKKRHRQNEPGSLQREGRRDSE